jgi:uncharacterized protein YwqG
MTQQPNVPLNLTHAQRKVLAGILPALADRLKTDEPASRTVPFTMKEVREIAAKCQAAVPQAHGTVRNSLRHIAEAAAKAIETSQGIGGIPAAERVYQFKITLKDIEPPIWRRIQTKDCTLDRLHGHIQTAMGWTNSHLHQFEIGGVTYGDPELLLEGFEDDPEIVDSLDTRISKIIPKDGKRFSFDYEYDFGDGWEHEVFFEGCLRAEKGTRYPLCIEGERACPPEDSGGPYGYPEYLEAMSARVAAAKRTLREEIEGTALARLADDLERLMVVSIRLKATAAAEKELQVGRSKLGGTPDLPEGTAWPECNGVPMALLAQFRLWEVASFDAEECLPNSGMLYFFYEAKDPKWGFDPKDREHWRVVYYDGDPATLRATVPPNNLPKESSFRPCELTLVNEITLPPWESQAIKSSNLSQSEWEQYVTLPGTGCGEGETIHRLLGYPEQIQGDMQLECQCAAHGLYMGDASGYSDPRRPVLEKGAGDWRLLLQIDTDEDNVGTIWGDVGRVYFWIRRQEMEKRDFNNVWLILQCY